MFDVFESLKSIIKAKEVRIDSHICKLHYKLTVLILIACSLVVTSKQYIGDPIACLATSGLPPKLIEAYCWIHSTFTIPNALLGKVGTEVAQPGVDKYLPGGPKIYHKYYQWVCFVLFFQGLLFYVPRYLWKIVEKNKVKDLLMDLNHPVMSKEDGEQRRNKIVEYLNNNLGTQINYALGYYFTVLCYMVNVIMQIWLMDAFLGGEFSTYGIKVVSLSEMNQEERVDPMIKVFPRVTKCTFHTFGPSGDVMKHDVLCVLPLNIVNEKSYVILWFWFVILSCLTGLYVLYCVIVISSRKVRSKVMRGNNRLTKREDIELFVNRSSIGDWLLLYLLAKNMDSLQFRDLMSELANKLKGNSSEKPLLEIP